MARCCVFVLCVSLCMCVKVATACDCAADMPTLQLLHSATNGQSWKRPWNMTAVDAPCGFDGVECASRGIAIELIGQGLSGTLPHDLSNFSSRLFSFNVADNSITGSLSEAFSRWTSLRYFNVSFNSLSGTLPPELSSWTGLEELSVDDNQLNGSLPSSYGALRNLTTFSVRNNKFTGTLPADFANWTMLNALRLENNRFTGTLPKEYSTWGSTANSIKLRDNCFNGSLPAEYEAWANINSFVASSNNFTGSLPSTYQRWSALTVLDVTANSLSGTLPRAFGAMVNLQVFRLGRNQIAGSIPREYSAWRKLTDFHVYYNSLDGTLPPEFGNWSLVENFAVYGNQLNGTLPATYASMARLRILTLRDNTFTGTLPLSYASGMTFLIAMDVSRNQLTGTIPSLYSKLPFLLGLSVSFNNITGVVPSSLPLITDVQNNSQLSGSLPTTFGSVTFGSASICGTNVSCPGEVPMLTLYCFSREFAMELSNFTAYLIAAEPYKVNCSLGKERTTHSASLETAAAAALPRQPSTTQALTAAMVYVSLTSVSSFGRSVVPGLQRSAAALRLRARCNDDPAAGDPDTPLFSTLADNPLDASLLVGGYALHSAAGAAVINALLVVAIAFGLQLFAIWQSCVSSMSSKWIAAVIETLPSSPLPGGIAVSFGTLLQPSVGACVALVVSNAVTSSSRACGIVMLSVWASFPCYCLFQVVHRGRRRGVFVLASRALRKPALKTCPIATLVNTVRVHLCEPATLWVIPRGSPTIAAFLRNRMEAVFGGYVEHREWFFAMEWALGVLSGIVLGVAEVDDDTCTAALWSAACSIAFTVVQLALHIRLRPSAVALEHLAALGLGGMALMGLIFTVSGAEDAANGFVSAASIIEIVIMTTLMLNSASLKFGCAQTSAAGDTTTTPALNIAPRPSSLQYNEHSQAIFRQQLAAVLDAKQRREEKLRQLVKLVCWKTRRHAHFLLKVNLNGNKQPHDII